jgi:hypothetical protein
MLEGRNRRKISAQVGQKIPSIKSPLVKKATRLHRFYLEMRGERVAARRVLFEYCSTSNQGELRLQRATIAEFAASPAKVPRHCACFDHFLENFFVRSSHT